AFHRRAADVPSSKTCEKGDKCRARSDQFPPCPRSRQIRRPESRTRRHFCPPSPDGGAAVQSPQGRSRTPSTTGEHPRSKTPLRIRATRSKLRSKPARQPPTPAPFPRTPRVAASKVPLPSAPRSQRRIHIKLPSTSTIASRPLESFSSADPFRRQYRLRHGLHRICDLTNGGGCVGACRRPAGEAQESKLRGDLLDLKTDALQVFRRLLPQQPEPLDIPKPAPHARHPRIVLR